MKMINSNFQSNKKILPPVGLGDQTKVVGRQLGVHTAGAFLGGELVGPGPHEELRRAVPPPPGGAAADGRLRLRAPGGGCSGGGQGDGGYVATEVRPGAGDASDVHSWILLCITDESKIRLKTRSSYLEW